MNAGPRQDEEDPPEKSTEEPVQRSAFEQLRELLPHGPTVPVTEDHVRSVLNVRRGRDAMFGPGLFSDPAWDVMLELYAARFGSRRMSASQLARVIGTPKSVMERWIAALLHAGLVAAESKGKFEPTYALTHDGAAKMGRLVGQWSSAFLAF